MTRRTRRSIRPTLERLEVRENPAGTVDATFTAGRLTLTGDAADNALLITQGPDNLLTISANGSTTQFRLNDGPLTTAITLADPVTRGVNISLGDGADQLVIAGVELPGSLTINGGNGDANGAAGNTIYLQGLRVGGNFGITNLAGADATYLLGTVDVGGGLTIRNGAGGSQVWGDQTTDLSVRGAFTVADGKGADKVDLWGTVNVSVGSLAFNSGLDPDGSYYRVHPFGNLTVAGSVRLSNGAGTDFADLGGQNVAVGGAISIKNGDGDSSNTILSLGAFSVGQIVITNGTGEDHTMIHASDTAIIRGSVSVINGPGGSSTYVGDGNLLSVGGNILFVNGSGRDLNTVFSGETRVKGSVTVRNGDGDSDTSIAAETHLLVGGSTRITSGAGRDLVFVGQGRVGDTTPVVDVGAVLVDNGDGGSDTMIVGTRLAVRGSVSIDAWDGTDRAIVASAVESGAVTGNVMIDIGPGDQQVVAVGAADGQILKIGKSLGIWTDSSIGLNAISLAGVDVRSWTDIETGDGSDDVRVTSSTFGGEFDLDTAAGNDNVYLEWAGQVTTFHRAVWVSTGDGDDRVWLAWNGAASGQAVFAGPTHWDGGAGAGDLIVLKNTGGVFLGPEPDLSGFEAAF